MDRKKNNSIEFETEKAVEKNTFSDNEGPQNLEAIKRHSFRVPCMEEDDTSVEIKGKQFDVLNIGSNGLGIEFNDEGEFQPGEILSIVRLRLGDKKYKLQGEVVHVSPDVSGKFLGGIRLLNMSRETEMEIRHYIEKMCASMFHHSHSSKSR